MHSPELDFVQSIKKNKKFMGKHPKADCQNGIDGVYYEIL